MGLLLILKQLIGGLNKIKQLRMHLLAAIKMNLQLSVHWALFHILFTTPQIKEKSSSMYGVMELLQMLFG